MHVVLITWTGLRNAGCQVLSVCLYCLFAGFYIVVKHRISVLATFSIEMLCNSAVSQSWQGHSLCITEGVDSFVNIDLFQYMCIDSLVRLPTNQV